MIREAYDAWHYLLTNEGESAAIASKLTAIGTGTVAATACFVCLKLIERRAEILDLIATAFVAAVIATSCALAAGWRAVTRCARRGQP